MANDKRGKKSSTRVNAREKQSSSNPSAVSHSEASEQYKNARLRLKKAYFCSDALHKLAEIYRIQYGKTLDTNHIDHIELGDLLSTCINYFYNRNFKKTKLPQGAPKKMISAKTPDGQKLYRYHHMSKVSDADVMEKVFNFSNKHNRMFFPVVACHDPAFFEQDDGWDDDWDDDWDDETDSVGRDEQPVTRWTTRAIQRIRDEQFIRDEIKRMNKEAKKIKAGAK